MKKISLLLIIAFISCLEIDAQSISVNLLKPTDTLMFEIDNMTDEASNTAIFKLAQGNKYILGQVTMKAHNINPFKLPTILLNDKIMNVGVHFPNLDKDAIFTFYNPADTGLLNMKSPMGENAPALNFVFSKNDLLEGDNEIKIVLTKKDIQNDLAITDLKLHLRAQLNSDNVIVQTPAEFPGGTKGWAEYLMNNINRDLPIRNGAPVGKYVVIVSFVVDKEGNLTDIKAENDLGYGTAEEAVRVLKNGPKWVPASQNGVNVIHPHRQTIVFQVSNSY